MYSILNSRSSQNHNPHKLAIRIVIGYSLGTFLNDQSNKNVPNDYLGP